MEPISIRESIILCIENNIKGAESQLASFDNAKPNRLRSNQIDALQKNLECIFEDVVIEGSGKRGKVFLTGLKSEVSEKEDKRVNNKRKPTDYDLLMDEYVFNFLLELNLGEALPYKSWANRIEFFDMSVFKAKGFRKHLVKSIHKLHKGTNKYTKEVNKKIIDTFRDTVRKRNIDVVKNAFGRLEKAGRIAITVKYFSYTIENDYNEITVEEAEQYKREENIILEEMKMSRKEYVSKKMYTSNRDEKYYEVSKSINNHMREKHGIKYYFEAVKVEILDDTILVEVSVKEKDDAYYNRLFTLTKRKANKYDELSGLGLEKEWYMLNTYTLLIECGVKVPVDDYEEEKWKLERSFAFAFNTEEIDEALEDLF